MFESTRSGRRPDGGGILRETARADRDSSDRIDVAASTPSFEALIGERPEPQSLKKLVVRGSLWAMVGFGAAQVLRFVSNAVMTRLLYPEAFGLMALVSVCLRGLQMLSDVGVRPSIIQNSRGDDRAFLDTAWTIQAMRGFVIWGVASVLGWPVSLFYETPQLRWMLPVAALTGLLAGLNSTAVISAQRHLQVHRVVRIDLVSAVVATIFMLALGMVWPSVWVLVIGSLVGSIAQLVLSYTAFPDSTNRFRWDKSSAGDLISFGR